MTQNDFRMLKVISMGVALESTGLVMIESVVTRPDDPSSDKFTTIDMFPVFTYSPPNIEQHILQVEVVLVYSVDANPVFSQSPQLVPATVCVEVGIVQRTRARLRHQVTVSPLFPIVQPRRSILTLFFSDQKTSTCLKFERQPQEVKKLMETNANLPCNVHVCCVRGKNK